MGETSDTTGTGESVPRKAPAKKVAAAKKVATPPRLGSVKGKAGRPSKAELIGKLEASVRSLADKLQLAGLLTGNEALSYDGMVLDHFAPDLAVELYDLASHNDRVAALLEQLYSSSERFGSLTTILAVAVPIAVAHGRLPSWAMKAAGTKGHELTAAIGEPPTPRPPLKPVPSEPEPAASTPPAPAPWRRPAEPEPEVEPVVEPTVEVEVEPAIWTGDHTTPVGVGDPTAPVPEPVQEGFALGWAPQP